MAPMTSFLDSPYYVIVRRVYCQDISTPNLACFFSQYQSVIIYFLAAGTYADSDVGIWQFGTTVTTQCLLVMSLHLAIETKSWVRADLSTL